MVAAKTLSVLLVDDDSFLLDIYSTKFREQGATVQIALSGDDAISLLKGGSFKPNVIVLDIVMPNIDGIEILKKIKEDNLAPGAKVVMLSNQQEDIERAKGAGADEYIIKANSTPSEVLTQIMAVFS